MNNIVCNISNIKSSLENLSKGARPAELLVVTKSFPAAYVKQALEAGITSIAESRIQEAQAKFAELGNGISNVKKHFIGHLQTNKAKKAVELFDVIQSLDSLRLAQAIDRHAADLGKTQECLIEVKVSCEASKTGFAPGDVISFFNECRQFSNIKITGLMTIAPVTDTPEEARPYFKQAASLFNEIGGLTVLSMGMSGDWRVAVEEGSTMIRVGSAIFGERNYEK